MPTGYTSGVQEGKVTDFTEYALMCARAFGACVTLRDDPLSAEIPVFEVDDHYENGWRKAKRELSEFVEMSPDEQEALRQQEFANNERVAAEGIARRAEERERYERMLRLAREYKPPTPDHDGFAKFLVSQLEDSIKWDCNTSYFDELASNKPSFEEWKKQKLATLTRWVKTRRESHKDEIERVRNRNEWVRQLKDSLGIN